MFRNLPLADASDPRVLPLVQAHLRKQRIPPEFAPTVYGLATGDIPKSSLACCGSGCRPCVQDVVVCAARTLQTLQDPRATDEALNPSGLVRRAGRKVVRGLARRLKERGGR